MLRKALMLLVVAVVLAWTAASQAAPVSFYFTEYSGTAIAENTSTHVKVQNEFLVGTDYASSPPASASATYMNANAYTSAGMDGYFLYAEAAETGESRLGQSWNAADLRFQATTNQVVLKFDYFAAAMSSGDASAEADLKGYLTDFTSNLWEFPFTFAYAASSGTPGDESASDSVSGSVNVTIAVVPGEFYALDLEVYWVYAEGYVGTAAYGQGWFDNLSLDDGNGPPPDPLPAPATWLLLGSGLSGLLAWKKSRWG